MQPSEWLPEILGKDFGDLADLETDFPFEAMARKMQDMLLPTMAAYADLGRSLHQGMLKKPATASSRQGRRKGRPARKR